MSPFGNPKGDMWIKWQRFVDNSMSCQQIRQITPISLDLGLFQTHLLAVSGADDFSTTCYRRLCERSARTQLFQHTGLLKLLLEALQGLVNRLVFFNVYNKHIFNLGLQIY